MAFRLTLLFLVLVLSHQAPALKLPALGDHDAFRAAVSELLGSAKDLVGDDVDEPLDDINSREEASEELEEETDVEEMKDPVTEAEKEVDENAPVFDLEKKLNKIEAQCRAAKRFGKKQLEALKAIIEMLNTTQSGPECDKKVPDAPKNCMDLKERGEILSGVYTIMPFGNSFTGGSFIEVYCDMETDGGGWTVFQRRKDGSQNFRLGWSQYAIGFGDLEGEFWLGNDALHLLTSQSPNELRVDMRDGDNQEKYAKFSKFHVGSAAEKYALEVAGYSGTAGDSLTNVNGMKFSTFDQDNDVYAKNCADIFKGAWWYSACHSSNLNGAYLNGAHTTYADGVNWRTWHGYHYSIQFTEMKIRPI